MAVGAFLEGALPFLAIADLVEATLDALPTEAVEGIDMLLRVDAAARETAQARIRRAFC